MRVIGVVKIDIHKTEKQFERITFSDVDCVKGLIKNRWIIDEYLNIEGNNSCDVAGDVKPLNQELIVTYIALDDLISKCNLNVKQRFIIEKLMNGYTEQDIADIFKQEVRAIYKTLDSICSKIKQINDKSWKYDYVYMNYKKVEWSYKRCSKCKAYKPANIDFFSPDNRNKSGFTSTCKSCR